MTAYWQLLQQQQRPLLQNPKTVQLQQDLHVQYYWALQILLAALSVEAERQQRYVAAAVALQPCRCVAAAAQAVQQWRRHLAAVVYAWLPPYHLERSLLQQLTVVAAAEQVANLQTLLLSRLRALPSELLLLCCLCYIDGLMKVVLLAHWQCAGVQVATAA
jgi:hypothetical protein